MESGNINYFLTQLASMTREIEAYKEIMENIFKSLKHDLKGFLEEKKELCSIEFDKKKNIILFQFDTKKYAIQFNLIDNHDLSWSPSDTILQITIFLGKTDINETSICYSKSGGSLFCDSIGRVSREIPEPGDEILFLHMTIYEALNTYFLDTIIKFQNSF